MFTAHAQEHYQILHNGFVTSSSDSFNTRVYQEGGKSGIISRLQRQPSGLIVACLQYNPYCLFMIAFTYFVSGENERSRGCAVTNLPTHKTSSLSTTISKSNEKKDGDRNSNASVHCVGRGILPDENEQNMKGSLLCFCSSHGINMPMQNKTAVKQITFNLAHMPQRSPQESGNDGFLKWRHNVTKQWTRVTTERQAWW